MKTNKRRKNYSVYKHTSAITLSAILIILLQTGCSLNNKKDKIDEDILPVMNISKDYQQKDICLQDIAEVNYIPLETTNDILLDNDAKVNYVSSNLIIIYNSKEGDVFLFDNKGKVIRTFNRFGQSGQEYTKIHDIIYDEKKHELIILSFNNDEPIFYVYDEYGNYKRTLPMPEGLSFLEAVNYNDDCLLAYECRSAFAGYKSVSKTNTPFMFLSKQDGSIIDTLPLVVKKHVSTMVVGKRKDETCISYIQYKNINKVSDGLVIYDLAFDTVYYKKYGDTLKPLIARTPSIREKVDKKSIFCFKGISKDYIFMGIQLIDHDFKNFVIPEPTNLALDRSNHEVFQYKLYNADYPTGEKVTTLEQALLIPYEELYEGLQENKIKGKLKNVAEVMDINDNPILMTVKLK